MYRISYFIHILILHLFLIFNICFGDSEGVQETTVYTQALLTVTYTKLAPAQGDRYLASGKYGDNSLKQTAKGYLFYSEKYLDWCKDLGPPIVDIQHTPWIALIPRNNCTYKEKILNAKKYNASAVIIYNTDEPLKVPIMTDKVPDFVSVMINGNTGRKLLEIIQKDAINGAFCEILVGTHFVDRKEWKVSRTSVLFVLVSFILLMCISLAWLVFYYVQRFRHIYRNDRKEKQLLNAAKKAISKLKTKSYQSVQADEDDACAVCLEGYKYGETLRILPCKHEYHKTCIDPWLLNHRTCPMCKTNILKALGVEIPDNVSLARHDIEQPAATTGPRPSSNQIGMEEPRMPVEEASASNDTHPYNTNITTTPHAWRENSASSFSSGSVISSDDTDSERSTMALVSPQRV